ncbi:DUF3987 domain-containing protein [Blastochloris tepida]|uniref:DNA primase n=1 Tax=Blastochloris tepida TaxID=2233851 RepID=A0A348G1I7_9HYPH|nr:DUF3987 domain-containing protein [Blastochloris tepida]BBF93420.1 DNA primase [Blastochloris tepida]
MNATNHAATEDLVSSPLERSGVPGMHPSQVRRELARRGWPPLPILAHDAPDREQPGAVARGAGKAVLVRGWQKDAAFDATPASEAALGAWERGYSHCPGTGIACGRVIGIDIDCLDAALAAEVRRLAEQEFGPTPFVRVGRAPKLLLVYQAAEPVPKRRFVAEVGDNALEILGEGSQFVSYGVHPVTCQHYEWTGPLSPLTGDPDDAPVISAAQIERFIDAVRGIMPLKQSGGWHGSDDSFNVVEFHTNRSAADTFFTRLNDKARANYDAWVPDLGLSRIRREPGGYAAVAEWRRSSTGRPLDQRNLNLSFDAKGITDWGDGPRHYSPLDVVMAALGLGVDSAVQWLGERVDPTWNDPPIILTSGARTMASTSSDLAPLAVDDGALVPAQPVAAVVEADDDGDDCEATFAPVASLEDLTHPPGLVGDIIDWCERTSERPARSAALGAALGFVSALAGRKFASPTDLRTNLYILTLAESGYGKDHARQAITRIADCVDNPDVRRLGTKDGLGDYLGPGRAMSATALRNLLIKKPSVLLQADEFHGTLNMMNERSSLARLLADDFLSLFSSASTSYAGAEYAGTPAVKLYAPNFSVHGLSTPSSFWLAAGSRSLTSGLLPRFILLNIDAPKPARREPEASIRDVPPDLVRRCAAIAQLGGNLHRDGTAPAPPPVVVPYTDAARAALEQFRAYVEEQEAVVNDRCRPFLHRAAEHAIKLALTVAVGVDCTRPRITGEVMEWACSLAWHSTCSFIAESAERIADNEREADYLRVFRLIKGAGPAGITEGVLRDRTRSIDSRRLADLLGSMVAAGRVRRDDVQTKKGKRPRLLFVR